MAADAWKFYNKGREYLLEGTVPVNSSLKMALFTSASNCNDATLSAPIYATLTNELANGSGYTTGGAAITSNAATFSGGTATFDCDDVTWTASGGSLTFRYAVIYVNATVNTIVKPLLCF